MTQGWLYHTPAEQRWPLGIRGCTFVVIGRYRMEPLLASGVPDLQLDRFVEGVDGLEAKVQHNWTDESFGRMLVDKAADEVGLAD